MKADVNAVLESLALQEATDGAGKGAYHGSTLCRLPVGSWQAKTLRAAPDIPHAMDPSGLRKALQDTAASVIFVPGEALVTLPVIERTCAESTLCKIIVWETD